MRMLIGLKISVIFAVPLFAQIKIDSPMRGWRSTISGKTDSVQEVNYPASFVNTVGKHDLSQLIRGHIGNTPKKTAPLTLVVNGLDMPLRPEGDTFSRPYIFGQGSNSVEVRNEKDRHAVQFFEAGASLTPARLRVLLSWDSDGTDLDLHLVTPEGEHCYYANRMLVSGAALDIDVTSGYGPEIISVPSPQRGTYLVYVNYYGGSGTGELTTAKISIVSQSGTPDEKIQSSLVPLRAPGELNLVKSFQYP